MAKVGDIMKEVSIMLLSSDGVPGSILQSLSLEVLFVGAL